MAIPNLFVVVAPMQSLEGGLKFGGAIRIKLRAGESAMLAFENTETAENYRNAFGLVDTRAIPLTELVRLSPETLRLPDQAAVFRSLEHLQSMQANPDTFDISKHLVQLPLP